MNIGDVYNRAHRAIIDAADEFDLTPIHVRILVDLYDAGEPLTTLQLEERLRVEGAAIRRAAPLLAGDESVSYRGVDGGRTRAGMRAQMTLQPGGTLVAEYVYARFRELGRA